MASFFSGMIAMGYAVAALFFFRFWKRTADSLFAIFGVSFVLLALGQTAGVVWQSYREDETWIYLFRLAAFILLLIAILAKNFSRSAKR
ncbi:MAG TPA: DUF5985 family protein [Xanthobacteraceae bacterium]|nr:DUF5985 family protein [Xanthobacteraceae bacterium]